MWPGVEAQRPPVEYLGTVHAAVEATGRGILADVAREGNIRAAVPGVPRGQPEPTEIEVVPEQHLLLAGAILDDHRIDQTSTLIPPVGQQRVGVDPKRDSHALARGKQVGRERMPAAFDVLE